MEILQVSLSVPFIHVKVLIRRIDVFSDERESGCRFVLSFLLQSGALDTFDVSAWNELTLLSSSCT